MQPPKYRPGKGFPREREKESKEAVEVKKQSAGLLVYRTKNGQLEVLIAHMGGPFHAKKDAGHWSIPKGEYDQGENPRDVARREFEEELGKKAPPGEWQDLGSIEYSNKKKVTAWVVKGDLDTSSITSNTFELEWPPRSGKMQEFPEIDKAGWFSLKEASQKLIPAQVEFLQRLADKLNVDFKSDDPSPSLPKQNSLF